MHGISSEICEITDRKAQREGRRTTASEDGARTKPNQEDRVARSTAEERPAGKSTAATKEKKVDGSVNTENRETVYIR